MTKAELLELAVAMKGLGVRAFAIDGASVAFHESAFRTAPAQNLAATVKYADLVNNTDDTDADLFLHERLT